MYIIFVFQLELPFSEISSRPRAIRYALSTKRRQDIVVIAGKKVMKIIKLLVLRGFLPGKMQIWYMMFIYSFLLSK